MLSDVRPYIRPAHEGRQYQRARGRRKIFATAYDVEAFSAFTLRGVALLQPACGLARKRSPVGVRKWPSSRSRPVLGTEDSCRLSAPRQNDGTLHDPFLQRRREMAPRNLVSCYNSAAIDAARDRGIAHGRVRRLRSHRVPVSRKRGRYRAGEWGPMEDPHSFLVIGRARGCGPDSGTHCSSTPDSLPALPAPDRRRCRTWSRGC